MKYPAHWATTQMDDLLSRLQSPSDSDFKVTLASPFFYHIPLPSPTDVTSQTFPDSVPSSVFILSLRILQVISQLASLCPIKSTHQDAIDLTMALPS